VYHRKLLQSVTVLLICAKMKKRLPAPMNKLLLHDKAPLIAEVFLICVTSVSHPGPAPFHFVPIFSETGPTAIYMQCVTFSYHSAT
jgi:hypothetical protein